MCFREVTSRLRIPRDKTYSEFIQSLLCYRLSQLRREALKSSDTTGQGCGVYSRCLRKRFPDYSSNLGRIAKQIASVDPEATAIDIGANIGDSVAIIRRQCFMPILCIEGDEKFLDVLKRNIAVLGEEVHVFGGFVAMETGFIEATVSSVNGSAHLRRASGMSSQLSAKSLQDIVKEFPKFQRPRLLKVDTDGFDAAILRGALSMLRDTRPIVFFEYDPFFLSANGDSGLSLLSELRSIGYSKALVYDNLTLHDQIRSGEIAYFSAKRLRPLHEH